MAGLEAAMAVQSPVAAEPEPAAEEEEIAAEDPAAAEEEEAPGPAAGRKRDVFYSKKSRKTALLANAAKATPAAKSAAERRGAAAAAAAAKETPGTRLAAWLHATLSAALAVPPTRGPGAAAATCRDVAALDCLSGSPREVVHRALTEPSIFLGLPPGVGFSSDTDDTCLAFQLLDQVSGPTLLSSGGSVCMCMGALLLLPAAGNQHRIPSPRHLPPPRTPTA